MELTKKCNALVHIGDTAVNFTSPNFTQLMNVLSMFYDTVQFNTRPTPDEVELYKESKVVAMKKFRTRTNKTIGVMEANKMFKELAV